MAALRFFFGKFKFFQNYSVTASTSLSKIATFLMKISRSNDIEELLIEKKSKWKKKKFDFEIKI
ncbi:hypothetical protein QR98_0049030 [Sarcoptes scabiei]|uniref:Uncharacterized protein n=1 Tax=Sarcoptes scabiei TaxID=52283 RepID=A0A132A633_SARSC|nr:hypothetical protein QR98_0049030 [Sarcoptes scabiei]